MKTAAVAVVLVAVGAASMAPAVAAPKKTITKTYAVTAATPDPTNAAAGDYSVCPQTVPGSFQADDFTIPAAGTLKVELDGYVGDWDALLMDSDKSEVGASGAGGYAPVAGGPEVIETSFKKKQTVTIVACNWAGGPTGTVKVTFTYKK